MSPTEEPIRVFLGADRTQRVPALVHAASLWRSVAGRHPLEIRLMEGDSGRLLRWSPEGLADEGPLPLAPARRPGRSGTGFSVLRFAIPALVGCRGRALYCDSDQVCLGDLLELHRMPLGGAPILSCSARPALGLPADALETSVLVIDAERCRNWDLEAMLGGLSDGRWSYRELTRLYGAARHWLDGEPARLDDSWNAMDDFDDATRLIHYTTREHQPWKNDLLPHAASRRLWEWVLRRELRDGVVSARDVLDGVRQGHLKPRLAELVEEVAPLRPRPRLSVVVEMETSGLAPGDRVLANLREVADQAAAVAEPGAEVLVTTSEPWSAPPPWFAGRPGCRVVVLPETSYYGLKNGGFAHARGEVVLFVDADCRIAPGYVERALAHFADPGTLCVTGRTRYARDGFLPRLNTALSFGYLHDREAATPHPYAVLSHNVAVRASDAAPLPFGTWRGRVGGDRFLTDWYRRRGRPPRFDYQLLVRHEDPSYSPALLLERHLREHLKHVPRPEDLRLGRSPGRRALASAVASLGRRRRKLRLYGGRVGLRRGEARIAVGVVVTYWLLDLLAVSAVLLAPPLGRRWLRYQNGR